MSPLPDFGVPETVTPGLPAKTARAGTELSRMLPHSFPTISPARQLNETRHPRTTVRHEPVTTLAPKCFFRNDAR